MSSYALNSDCILKWLETFSSCFNYKHVCTCLPHNQLEIVHNSWCGHPRAHANSCLLNFLELLIYKILV